MVMSETTSHPQGTGGVHGSLQGGGGAGLCDVMPDGCLIITAR